MKIRFIIVLFAMLVPIGKAWTQCVDATFISTFNEPFTSQAVNFLYWGDVPFDATWTYDLDYGNGTSVTGATAPLTNRNLGSATYAAAGTYTVTLTVYDASLCSETYSIILDVANSVGNCNPASWGPFEQYYCTGDNITFGVSINGPITLEMVEWDFGDGSTAVTTTNTVVYHYDQPGIYFVKARTYLDPLLGCGPEYASTTTSGPSGTVFVDFRVIYVRDADAVFTMSPATPSATDAVTFTYSGDPTLFPPNYTNTWEYEFYLDAVLENSGTGITNGMTLHTENPIGAGAHTATLDINWDNGGVDICPQQYEIEFVGDTTECDTCNSFKPFVNEKYWFSAWVQKDGGQVPSYDDVSVDMVFVGPGTTVTLYPSGEIIDGWQRIAGEFTIPYGTVDLQIELNAGDNTTYFDDIRIHPFNGSMKSYVYDGETFWLVAELDDNNYATIYEYDAEGGLIRIKKETSGGIVTIQETRSNTIKVTP